MRSLRMAMDFARATFDPARLGRWARIGSTVIATTVAVALASFVAIAMGLH
jgi:hypothetical protein